MYFGVKVDTPRRAIWRGRRVNCIGFAGGNLGMQTYLLSLDFGRRDSHSPF